MLPVIAVPAKTAKLYVDPRFGPPGDGPLLKSIIFYKFYPDSIVLNPSKYYVFETGFD